MPYLGLHLGDVALNPPHKSRPFGILQRAPYFILSCARIYLPYGMQVVLAYASITCDNIQGESIILCSNREPSMISTSL